MRIELNQTIAGFSATQIRQLMRETLGGPISLRRVKQSLRCPESTARRVLVDLEREGLIQPVDDHLEPSLKGSALAQATAARPLVRNTAQRLVADLVLRARLINLDDDWAYRVGMLVVFGSYVDGVERPNDIDVACQLVPRWRGEVQREAEQSRRAVHEGRFRNISLWAAWPKLEILRFLKSRSRGLSIQELDDWILKQERHMIIFRDG
jgi:hypothetical protein